MVSMPLLLHYIYSQFNFVTKKQNTSSIQMLAPDHSILENKPCTQAEFSLNDKNNFNVLQQIQFVMYLKQNIDPLRGDYVFHYQFILYVCQESTVRHDTIPRRCQMKHKTSIKATVHILKCIKNSDVKQLKIITLVLAINTIPRCFLNVFWSDVYILLTRHGLCFTCVLTFV